MQAFRGTGVALITPFARYAIDYPALEKVIDHVINGGVDYVVALGSTGESATLSNDEKRRVLDFTIEKVDGRVPLVAGNFGGNDTAGMCRYIDQFDFTGISAILSSNPAYNKPSQEGLFLHYQAIAEHCPVPVILYNVPGRTASNMLAQTTLRIAHHCPTVIGVKEASADMTQASQILHGRPDGFLVLSGDDPTAFPLVGIGGDGVISVIANVLPQLFSTMIRAALGNNRTKAQLIHESLLDIHPLLYREGNPTGIKGAASIYDLCGTEVRLPLTPISAELHATLKERLVRLEVNSPLQTD